MPLMRAQVEAIRDECFADDLTYDYEELRLQSEAFVRDLFLSGISSKQALQNMPRTIDDGDATGKYQDQDEWSLASFDVRSCVSESMSFGVRSMASEDDEVISWASSFKDSDPEITPEWEWSRPKEEVTDNFKLSGALMGGGSHGCTKPISPARRSLAAELAPPEQQQGHEECTILRIDGSDNIFTFTSAPDVMEYTTNRFGPWPSHIKWMPSAPRLHPAEQAAL